MKLIYKKFHQELEQLINKHNMEIGSDTPDFILAEFLIDCLIVFDAKVKMRDKWYNRSKVKSTRL